LIEVFDQQRPWHHIRRQRKSKKEKRRRKEEGTAMKIKKNARLFIATTHSYVITTIK